MKSQRQSTTPNRPRTSQVYTNLPTEFFPDCWSDDERMDVLFSPFRSKALNPVNYETKLKFWKNQILKYCEQKGSCCVSVVELKHVFERKGKVPYCLQTVVEEMANSDIRPKDVFMEAPQNSWGSWAVNALLKRPVSWGFSKVKEIRAPADFDETAEFVVLEAAQRNASQLLNTMSAKPQSVFTIKDIHSTLPSCRVSEEGLSYALHLLECQNKLAVDKRAADTTIDKNTLFKFAQGNSPVLPITKIDRSIFELERKEQELINIVEQIELEIQETDRTIRVYVHDQKRQLAKNFLKKKHLLEKKLTKWAAALENIQTTLTTIHDTKNSSQLFDALQQGSNALKVAQTSSGLTVDAIDDLLLDIKEMHESNDEIQNMMGTPIIPANSADDAELEDELADLMKDTAFEDNDPSEPPLLNDTLSDTIKLPTADIGDLSNEKQDKIRLKI